MNDGFNEIVEFAEVVKVELAEKYLDSPVEELVAWLKIAVQREALVSEAYSRKNIESQVAKLNYSKELTNIVIQSIEFAWAQETAHHRYAESVLMCLQVNSQFNAKLSNYFNTLYGKILGNVLGNLTSNNTIKHLRSKIALAIGSHVEEVPSFLVYLKKRDFKTFCQINQMLESTAISAYERMMVLIRQIENENNNRLMNTSFFYDIRKIFLDETYHYKIFEYLSNLDRTSEKLSPEEFISDLDKIRKIIYGRDEKKETILEFSSQVLISDEFIVFIKDYFSNKYI